MVTGVALVLLSAALFPIVVLASDFQQTSQSANKSQTPAAVSSVSSIELIYDAGGVRVRIAVQDPKKYTHQIEQAKNGRPYRIILDCLDANHNLGAYNFRSLPQSVISSIRTSQFAVTPRRICRIVLDLKKEAFYRVEEGKNFVDLYVTDRSAKRFPSWNSSVWLASKKTSQNIEAKSSKAKSMSSMPAIASITTVKISKTAVNKKAEKTVTAKKSVSSDKKSFAQAALNVPEKTATKSSAKSGSKPAVKKSVAKTVKKTVKKIVKQPVSKTAEKKPVKVSPVPTGAKNPVDPPVKTLAMTQSIEKKPEKKSVKKYDKKTGAKNVAKSARKTSSKIKAAPAKSSEKSLAVVTVKQSEKKAKSSKKSVAVKKSTKKAAKKVSATTLAQKTQESQKTVVAKSASNKSKTLAKVSSKSKSNKGNNDKKATVALANLKNTSAQKASKGKANKVKAKKTKAVKSGSIFASTANAADANAALKTSLDGVTRIPDKAYSAKYSRMADKLRIKLKGTQVAQFPKRLTIKYDAHRSRDPFATLFAEKSSNDRMLNALPRVESLTMVGILKDSKGHTRGLFEDIDGRGYILSKGDRVEGGTVLKVTQTKAYFQVFEYGWSRTISLTLDG